MSERISILLPDLRAGGAQRVLLILARAFVAKGFRVDIVVGMDEGELLSDVPAEAQLLSLCSRAPALGRTGLAFAMLTRLTRYLRNRQPDALLSTLTGTNLVASVARRLAGVNTRLVLREASPLVNLRSRLYVPIMRHVYRWADVVVALAPEMKDELVHDLRIPPHQVMLIPNPLDWERLKMDASVPLPPGFDAAQPYILAVGRLAAPKDYSTLLQAFARVVRALSVNLVILGEGPDRPKIEAQIRDLSLNDKVQLRGFDSNPYRWMARAAVLVLSSRWEGYPNVLLEAQGLGLPVVATAYGASAYTLVQKPGHVVAVGDCSALAEAILATLTTSRPTGIYSDPIQTSDSVEKYLALLIAGWSKSRADAASRDIYSTDIT